LLVHYPDNTESLFWRRAVWFRGTEIGAVMVDEAARFQEAVGLVEAGRFAEADMICLELLDRAPANARAAFLRGLIAMQQGDAARAVMRVRIAVDADPDNPTFLATLGAFLINHGDPAGALAALERATALHNRDSGSIRHMARLYRQAGRSRDAIASLRKIVELGEAEIADFLALGAILQAEGDPNAAVAIFKDAVKMAPDDVLVQNHLAACQQVRGNVGAAMTAYRHSLALQSGDNPASVGVFATMTAVCDWRHYDESAAQVDAMTDVSVAAGNCPVEDPFLNVSHCMSPQRNFDVARLWSGALAARVAEWNVSFPHAPRRRDRIRIGYLSSDLHDHATSHLMLGLFGAHDRARFSIHAYSCGPDDGSAYRRRIAADCDAFVDLSGEEAIAAARHIHDDGIDILVDLKGYTRLNRLDIAALRPAPLQVAWLGFPGTSGAGFFDYIVTDDIVTPPYVDDAYSEALAVLPHCYQVNNGAQEIADAPITRAKAGLPENALVFASFNNTYKLEPVMFAAWMEILGAVPNSVLWLLPNNTLAIENLRREATAAGVDPNRLVIADMLPKAEHLKRAGLADLALDTRIYNGHTTTSDMLWAGVPVLTLKGTHFASRVSASLLSAFGLPELITETLEDYRILACDLARSSERLSELRERTATLRRQSPLFDTAKFARDLERAFAEMWRRHENGEPPERLAVSKLN
jgi:protein O-GlcNAc transferase